MAIEQYNDRNKNKKYSRQILRLKNHNRELKQATFLSTRTSAGVNRAVIDGE